MHVLFEDSSFICTYKFSSTAVQAKGLQTGKFALCPANWITCTSLAVAGEWNMISSLLYLIFGEQIMNQQLIGFV